MSYENKQVLRDGAITLYTRNGQPTYHCRIKIDGHKGYVVKSTKRTEFGEASKVAIDLYEDLRHRARYGLEVKTHTFETIWKEWLKNNRLRLSEDRLTYLVGTANRYLLKFFGPLSLEQISNAKVEEYWDWRVNYWSSSEGIAKIGSAQKSRTTDKRPYKQKLGNVAKMPSQKTLEMEQSALRQILRWAHSRGSLNRLPTVKVPSRFKKPGVSRRPSFELKEWQSLYRYLRDWVKEEYDPSKPDKRPNSFHRWQRELIRSYILFMGTSGLRPNEARQLRWKDIEQHVDPDGIEHLVLCISPTTKTGQRDCIPLRSATRYLERVRQQSLHTEPDHLVFCNRDGQPIENFGKTFKKILTDAGLLTDRFGKTRTVYSLRHTYCTFKLLYGHTDITLLAQNMGTSPIQIFNHYRHITVRQKAGELSGKLNPTMSRKGLYF